MNNLRFQRLENYSRIFPMIGKFSARFSNRWKSGSGQSGAALIVTLWVLIILSLLISGFAFEMHVEANVTSYYRKRLKAQYLARAGTEWAKFVLVKSQSISDDDVATDEEDQAAFLGAKQMSRGVAVRNIEKELGDGKFVVDIVPEEGRRNVNTLSDDEWKELLDQTRVPEEIWDELIGCFRDWVDENDEHRINGAESDDPYYTERGYEVNNEKIRTIDELALIKNFTPEIVYGGLAEDEADEPYLGIARHLTVWGEGRVNVNTASKEVLMTFLDMDEYLADDIINGRAGIDGETGTEDDGYQDVAELESIVGAIPESVKGNITTTDRTYLRVVSVGEVGEVKTGIWCIYRQDGANVTPVYWREEIMR